MRVSQLSLASWRNYDRAEVVFEPGISVLVGPNGQGKTNLVEAVGYLSTLSSHRVAAPTALIHSGADAAIIRALLMNGDRQVRAELQLHRTEANTAQLNGAPVKPRELTRYCHSVLFAPEDLGIVRGDPAERRRYLDELLVQLTPRLAGVFADYDRVLKQRTNLLKTARGLSSVATLEVWSEKLIALGSEIVRERGRLIDRLRAPFVAAYRQIVDADHQPTIALECSWGSEPDGDVAARFAEALAEVYPKERERGLTLVGPHRDDLLLGLNDLPVKGYASHGESWSIVLALKLAAAAVLRQDSSVGDPILILDDVFAELDRHRRERLAAAVTGFEQVLITAAVVEDVPAEVLGNVWYVQSGVIADRPFVGDEP